MPDTCTLNLNVYDGQRQLFSDPEQIFVTIIDSFQKKHFSDYCKGPSVSFTLPYYNNDEDIYTVIVSAKGYQQTGFVPVHTSKDTPAALDLMLVPSKPEFRFVDATWLAVSRKYPFIGGDVPDAAGEQRYEDMMESDGGKITACLLNLCAAMDQILLSQGTPTTYLKQVEWKRPPQQDRFFAYCDPKLLDLTRQAAAAAMFEQVSDLDLLLHPGATCSYKQIEFGEANVQLTFHENDTAAINGVNCIMVEPDIDYYKDLAAHSLFEVIPNELTGELTDPVEVYVLRWQAGVQAGIPEFKPMYVID